MAKRVLMVVIAATAISIPAAAGAAGSKQKHKGKAHPISGQVNIANINPPGAINVTGSQTFAGTIDGKVSGKPVIGAIRGRNTYKIVGAGATFTGTLTDFSPEGSWTAKTTGKGVLNSSGGTSFTGSGTIVSGTGIYKGAKGSFTFKGSNPAKDADGDNDAVIGSFTTTGTVTY